jgi:putative ABC transport system permease protein
MDIPIISGRSFTNHDDSTSAPVIVVSEAMARAYWPRESPLGKRIGWAGNDTSMATVIGVAGDVRDNPNLGPPETSPTYYTPTTQSHPWRTMSFIVRTREDPAAMAHRIERAMASVAPSVAPGSVMTLEHLRAGSLSPQRVTSEMMGAFALMALLLAAVGIHGVLSYNVAQRTHDIGVRTALGAQRADILRAVMVVALQPVVVGLAMGMFGAVLMIRGLAHLLIQLSPNDPASLVGAVIVLIVAALAGCYWPARRAMRVDPVVALRRGA